MSATHDGNGTVSMSRYDWLNEELEKVNTKKYVEQLEYSLKITEKALLATLGYFYTDKDKNDFIDVVQSKLNDDKEMDIEVFNLIRDNLFV